MKKIQVYKNIFLTIYSCDKKSLFDKTKYIQDDDHHENRNYNGSQNLIVK